MYLFHNEYTCTMHVQQRLDNKVKCMRTLNSGEDHFLLFGTKKKWSQSKFSVHTCKRVSHSNGMMHNYCRRKLVVSILDRPCFSAGKRHSPAEWQNFGHLTTVVWGRLSWICLVLGSWLRILTLFTITLLQWQHGKHNNASVSS